MAVLAALTGLAALSTAGTVLAGSNVDAGSAKVNVVLKEWKLVASTRTVRAGRVSFQVANMGTLKHELVVLRSDAHHHALPVRGGVAVELGRRGETRPLAPGASRTLTVTLRPGRYVLLCNLLGHYKAGQFAALRAR